MSKTVAERKSTRARLITHRDVAKLCGITPRRIRAWTERGQWPEPHSVVEQTWFYLKSEVDHYLEHGTWPKGIKYRLGVGAGRKLEE